MTLLLIAVGGALGVAAVVGMLEAGWRRNEVRAGSTGSERADPLALAEDLERDATAHLLAGRITAPQYRATMAALACGTIAAVSQPER